MSNDDKIPLWERIKNAAVDKLPDIVLSALGVLTAALLFIGGLILGLRADVDKLQYAGEDTEFCHRVRDCPVCEAVSSAAARAEQALAKAEAHVEAHNRESEIWKGVIKENSADIKALKDWLYQNAGRRP